MSDQLEAAVQSAIDDSCQTFASGIATSQEDEIARAMQDALIDPTQFDNRLEASLLAIPNLKALFDKEAILKMVGDLWDAHVEPWNFPQIPDQWETLIKAGAKRVVLYVAGVVVDRIFGT